MIFVNHDKSKTATPSLLGNWLIGRKVGYFMQKDRIGAGVVQGRSSWRVELWGKGKILSSVGLGKWGRGACFWGEMKKKCWSSGIGQDGSWVAYPPWIGLVYLVRIYVVYSFIWFLSSIWGYNHRISYYLPECNPQLLTNIQVPILTTWWAEDRGY